MMPSLVCCGDSLPTQRRCGRRPVGGRSKNHHFRDMLAAAKERGFQPQYVLFDSWYTSLENLKEVRANGWLWLSQLKSNRLVNPDGKGNVPVQTLEVPPQGRQVHLRGY